MLYLREGGKLKKAVFVACTCIMFLSVALTGCEFFGSGPSEASSIKNYIKVTLRVRVQAVRETYEAYWYKVGEKSHLQKTMLSSAPIAGETLKIVIEKAGGENAIFFKTTDSNGFTDIVDATFNVYKEQPVTVFSDFTIREHVYAYYQAWEEYPWEQIWEAAGGFGEACTFTSMLTVRSEECIETTYSPD